MTVEAQDHSPKSETGNIYFCTKEGMTAPRSNSALDVLSPLFLKLGFQAGLVLLKRTRSSCSSSRTTAMACEFRNTESSKQNTHGRVPGAPLDQAIKPSTTARVKAKLVSSISTVHFQLTLMIALFTSSSIISWNCGCSRAHFSSQS